jgi:hypothetical protein
MANRSYIYAHQPGAEPEYRDLGEWKSNVPIAHLVLVGCGAQPVPSMLWDVDEKIALRGDAERGLAALEGLLDWLEPRVDDPSFAQEKERALAMLQKDDRGGEFFHLEPGEVYDLMALSLPEMEAETERLAARALELGTAALSLADPNVPPDAGVFESLGLESSWEEELGLYFPGVLYFHVG